MDSKSAYHEMLYGRLRREGMADNNDKRICDKCDNFSVHPSGVVESCACVRFEPPGLFSLDYTKARINGNEAKCKGFKRLKDIGALKIT